MDRTLAYIVDVILGGLIVASLLFADWEYMFSEDGTWILLLVGFIYLVFIITMILVTRAAQKPGPQKETSTSQEIPAGLEQSMRSYRLAMLIFLWIGVILIVVSITVFEPGEGVVLNAIGSVSMVIAVILFFLWNNKRKSYHSST